MDILETQNSLEKPIKGELKSIDVPDVGTVEYSEHFLELSSATRRRLDVEDLEGFKVKKVLSLPPALETQFKGIFSFIFFKEILTESILISSAIICKS